MYSFKPNHRKIHLIIITSFIFSLSLPLFSYLTYFMTNQNLTTSNLYQYQFLGWILLIISIFSLHNFIKVILPISIAYAIVFNLNQLVLITYSLALITKPLFYWYFSPFNQTKLHIESTYIGITVGFNFLCLISFITYLIALIENYHRN